MRVLLDECDPRKFRRELPRHTVQTIPEMGWSGLKNGALLMAMSVDGFEVLVTVDQNLRYQQNLASYGAAIVVMVAATNRIEDLRPLASDVLQALTMIQPGEIIEVG